MWCVGRRGGGEVDNIFDGGMKRLGKQFHGRKMHTRSFVRIILRRIRGGIKA